MTRKRELPIDDSYLDIVLRRVLLEICLMFKEATIILKNLEGLEIPIAQVVKHKYSAVFAFSRSGSKLKTKLQDSSRPMVNTFILNEKSFSQKMFCLYEGRQIEQEITYLDQMYVYFMQPAVQNNKRPPTTIPVRGHIRIADEFLELPGEIKFFIE